MTGKSGNKTIRQQLRDMHCSDTLIDDAACNRTATKRPRFPHMSLGFFSGTVCLHSSILFSTLSLFSTAPSPISSTSLLGAYCYGILLRAPHPFR